MAALSPATTPPRLGASLLPAGILAVVAMMVLPLPLAPLRWLAPFAGPDLGTPSIVTGDVVVVPWQGGVRAGLVVGTDEVSASRALELKEAIARLELGVRTPTATVAWILDEAERTVAPAGTVLAGLSPAWARVSLDHAVRELDPEGGPPSAWRRAERLEPQRLSMLREQGLLEERIRPARPVERVLVAVGEDVPTGASREAQRIALARLRADGSADSAAALARAAGVGESPVRTLIRNGFARYETRPGPTPPPTPPPTPRPWPEDASASNATMEDAAAAGWIALAQVMDHLEIALIYGGVFVGLGLIFLALTRTKRAAVTMAPSVNAPASTVAPAAGIAAFGGLSAAFVQGISAGMAAGRGTPPDDEHDHLH